MEERDYRYYLCLAGELSPILLHRLLSLYGSAEQIYKEEKLPVSPAQERALAAAKKRLPEALRERDAWEKQGLFWCSQEETAYPSRLKKLGDAPLGLFWRGRLPLEEAPSAGIIGARSCSLYGRSMAERFGGELGERGFSVISGMARGIDGYAQAAALKKDGASFAILGCGVDICYPTSNQNLYNELLEKGGIISEYPPGTPPLPHHFPLRNRLIAAFSDVLLVLEAREKSGTLITVDQALEQGKEVLAMPGRVGDALSGGCNRLIREGAGLLSCCGDIYEALGMENAAPSVRKEALPADLKPLWRLFGAVPRHVEELMDETGCELGELSLKLLALEERGYIREVAGGSYIRC